MAVRVGWQHVLFYGKHFRPNWVWLGLFLGATIGAALWYTYACLKHQVLLGGSSFEGLIFGISGGALILFEFALWPRKWLPFCRAFRSRWVGRIGESIDASVLRHG